MNTPTFRIPCLSFALAAAGFAQDQAPSRTFDEILVPVHTTPDDPTGAEFGIWSAGPDYKARFDDGFEYYPVLGSAYPENLPLRWTTTSVRIGATELTSGSWRPERAGDFRYEYHAGDVVEAYDIRLDGIEQTFRIAQVPADGGELVVTGLVTTQLVAEPTTARHGSLVFRGPAGEKLVDYGAVTAVDAAGRTFPMTTSFDGERVQLRLPAESVAAARFPLLVDPVIGTDSTREAGMTAVAAVDEATAGSTNVMCAYTRVNSATDHDMFAVMARSDMSVTTLAFADIAAYSSEKIALAAEDDQGLLILAVERRQGFTAPMQLYAHHFTSAIFQSGDHYVTPTSTGEQFLNPDVGGARGSITGSQVCVVYDYKANGSTDWRIRGFRYHTITEVVSFLPADIAAPSSSNHQREPAITPYAAPSWAVCWDAEASGSGHIFGRKVHQTGTQDIVVQILQPPSSASYSRPRIAGVDGRFVVTWNETPIGFGVNRMRARRLDWPNGSGATLLGIDTLASGADFFANGGVACDSNTESHWISTYRRNTGLFTSEIKAARLGHTGTLIDTVDVHSSESDQPFEPSIAFNRRVGADSFAVVYATGLTPNNTVLGQTYGYPDECYVHQTYGSGCGTVESETWDPTIAGSEYFTLRLEQHYGGVAACLFSPLQSAVPLDALGMNGCTMLVEPALTIAAPGTLIGPRFEVTFALPDDPAFTGFFSSQWFYFEPGANALDLVANSGVVHECR